MLTDILIITALFDELAAVWQLGDGGRDGWSNEKDPSGFPYHCKTFGTVADQPLRVAAAWAGSMGETAAAVRSSTLIRHLRPLTLGMCGICAGRRDKVSLGDVIVADSVFSYDHGKLIATVEADGQRIETLYNDIKTYELDPIWAINAVYFRNETAWQRPLVPKRPLSLDSQRRWLLRTLFDHQEAKGVEPLIHPDRATSCPSWPTTLAALENKGHVSLQSGSLALTTNGLAEVERDRLFYPDGIRKEPTFRTHVGPIATGKTVREDPELFQRIAKFSRKVLGVEMEAAAIGFVAQQARIPSIIVKSVSDFGDEDKDDGFREFACHASATFLLAFLMEHPPRPLLYPDSPSQENNGPQIPAARVFDVSLEAGTKFDLPVSSMTDSIYYCELEGGRRTVGIALNNSGLLAYVAQQQIMRAVSFDRKQRYDITPLKTTNPFIRFAKLGGSTHGLPPTYQHQMDLLDPKSELGKLRALGKNGMFVSLQLSSVSAAIVISSSNAERVLLQDMIIATVEHGSGQIIGGPVISPDNELVGFAIAGAGAFSDSFEASAGDTVVIWPWISLENAMADGLIES